MIIDDFPHQPYEDKVDRLTESLFYRVDPGVLLFLEIMKPMKAAAGIKSRRRACRIDALKACREYSLTGSMGIGQTIVHNPFR